MTFAFPLIVLLVIAAVAVALRAGGGPRRPARVGLAVLLLVVAFGAFGALWRASRLPRSVALAYSRTASEAPTAVVRLDDGQLVIRADYLQECLPVDVRIVPPAAPRLAARSPDDAKTPSPTSLPQPPVPPSERDGDPLEIAAAVERYFDELLRDKAPNKPGVAEFRSLLARLKSAERRRLADEVAQHRRELTRLRILGEQVTSPDVADTFTLQLEGGPDRWRRLGALGDTRAAQHKPPAPAIRLVLLIGTTVVAAAVLRSTILRSSTGGRPPAGS